jgi:hypothetical protein
MASSTFFFPSKCGKFSLFWKKLLWTVAALHFSSSDENSPLRKTQCEIGDLCICPLLNKPFHVCLGEIQNFLDGTTGNPKKVINYKLSLLTHR